MAKIETIVSVYNHCGDCPHLLDETVVEGICMKTMKKIKRIWGKIPKECPLPDKKEEIK